MRISTLVAFALMIVYIHTYHLLITLMNEYEISQIFENALSILIIIAGVTLQYFADGNSAEILGNSIGAGTILILVIGTIKKYIALTSGYAFFVNICIGFILLTVYLILVQFKS